MGGDKRGEGKGGRIISAGNIL